MGIVKNNVVCGTDKTEPSALAASLLQRCL